jgi:hypothetical protein
MSNPIVFDASINTAGMAIGANQAEAIINKMAVQVQAKAAAMNKAMGTMAIGGLGGLSTFGGYITNAERAVNITGNLSNALNRLTGVFNGGLGIGIAVGGLAALVGGFTKAIEKAKQFEVAQLSIGATIQSAYQILDHQGKELSGPLAFNVSQREARYLNKDIIERQRKNILTYEEELQAFQASLMAGSRKGLSPEKVLDVAELAGIVAKSTGAHGEEIGHAARLILGGGVNVSRSRIGQLLGVSNQDIKGRTGDDYLNFIMGKMKGFKDKQMTESFAASVEGITSTLESQFDVLWSRVGKNFMDKMKPSLQKLGSVLEGAGGDQLVDTLSKLFIGVFTALEKIATSPAIPVLMKFFNFIAGNADKIIITTALLKLVQVLGAVAGAAKFVSKFFTDLGIQSTGAAIGVDKLTAANQRLAASTAGVAASGGAAGLTGAMAANALVMGANGKYMGPQAAKKLAAQRAIAEEEARFSGMALMPLPSVANVGLTSRQRRILEHNTPLARRAQVEAQFLAQNAVPGQQSFERATLEAQYNNMWYAAQQERLMQARMAEGAIKIPVTERMAAGWANAKLLGQAALPYLGRMGNNAFMATMGTQVAGMVMPQKWSQSPEWDFAQKAIIGGAVAKPLIPVMLKATGGLGSFAGIGGRGALSLGEIAGAGGAAGVAGTAGAVLSSGLAGWLIGSYINKKLWQKPSKKEAEAEKALKETRAGLKDIDIYDQKEDIERKIKDYELAKKGKGDLFKLARNQKSIKDSLAYGLNYDALIANEKKKLADLEKERTARIASVDKNKAAVDLENDAKKWQSISSIGYGPENLNRQLKAESLQKKSTLEKLFSQGSITEDQRNRLSKEIDSWTADQRAKESLGKQKLEASLKAPTLQNKYAEGLLGVEENMLPWKSTLPAAEYKKFLAVAKKRFEKDFNMPLKKTEEQISALSMGVSSENVAESVRLAYKATELKLKEMLEVSQATKDKILAQAKASMDMQLALNQDAMHNQSFGTSSAARIYGQGDQQLHLASYRRQGMLAGAGNMNMLQRALSFGEDIQNARSVLAPDELRRYARDQYKNTVSDIKNQYLETKDRRRQLQLQSEQADTNAKTWNWNLTDYDQQAQDYAKKQAAWEEAKRRGPISYEDRLEFERKALRDRKDAVDADSVQATKALKEFNAKFPTGQVSEDFKKAMQTATAGLNDLMRDIDTGKVDKSGSKPVNNINIKIDPKVGLTDREKVVLAEEVKQRICRELKASGNRG